MRLVKVNMSDLYKGNHVSKCISELNENVYFIESVYFFSKQPLKVSRNAFVTNSYRKYEIKRMKKL